MEKKKGFVEKFLSLNGYVDTGLSDFEVDQVFSIISRQEELELPMLYDGFNWEWTFCSLSRQANARFPIVDRLLKSWEHLGKIQRKSGGFAWPNDKGFVVCLTHDVDVITRYPWKERFRAVTNCYSLSTVRKLRFAAASVYYLLKKLIENKADLDLSIWLEVEQKYGFNSTFFFLADLQHISQPDFRDCFYRYSDKVVYKDMMEELGKVISDVNSLGWDIGIHGSIGSHLDSDKLKKQIRCLECYCAEKVISGRQHYLCFDSERSPVKLSEAGIEYDSSLGSNIDYGYRAGTGRPFPMWDFNLEKSSNLFQVPLVIQDNAILTRSNYKIDVVLNICREIFEEAKANRSVVTILWHNNYDESSINFKAYSAILSLIDELNGWGCSVRQLGDHCAMSIQE